MSSPAELDIWIGLTSGSHEDLIAEASLVRKGDLVAVQRLRRSYPADLVRVALVLAQAREKASRKMPSAAPRLLADPEGVEMASSEQASTHKARTIGARTDAQILDLCCGIGGDAIGLARAGLRVTTYDLDPVRAWMAEQNAGCPSHAVDVTSEAFDPNTVVHIDPARRDGGGKRKFRLDEIIPSPDAVRSILDACAGGGVKLAPGIDGRELAEGATEFISEQGRLTQQVLWTGDLCDDPGINHATLLGAGDPFTLSGEPDLPPLTEAPSDFVYTMDPAIERARLSYLLCDKHELECVADPGTGLLTSEEHITSPGLTAYRVLDTMPWQPKRAKRKLRELGAGIVAVKTRAGVVDTDRLQHQLRGEGDRSLTVFAMRLGRSVACLICEPA